MDLLYLSLLILHLTNLWFYQNLPLSILYSIFLSYRIYIEYKKYDLRRRNRITIQLMFAPLIHQQYLIDNHKTEITSSSPIIS